MTLASIGINAILWLLQLIALIVGIIVTAMARRNHGRAALMGLFGCLALLLGVIVNVVQSLTLPSIARNLPDIYTAIMLFSALHTILWLAGIGLLIAGVVMRRPTTQPQQPYYQQPPPLPGYPGQ